MVIGDLPNGWTWTTLGEAFKWGSGGTPSRSVPEYYGGKIPWAIIGDLNDGVVLETAEMITEEGLKNSSAKLVEEGSILIAMYGSIGKLGIASKSLATNQAIAFTKPTSANPKFLFYYLLKERNNLNSLGSGNTQKNISQTIIKAYPFPVVPLLEQERIVAKIEELFTQLEAGTAALERVQAGLKRYKASVLKAACEGRLFGDVKLGNENLPANWKWIKVKEAGKVQLGRQRAPKHHEGTHMRPYLRVANVFEDRIDLTDVKEMNFTPAEYEIYKLEYGDILLNEGQSPEFLGRPAMYKGELPGGCFQNTLIRFQAFDFVDRNFALIVFRHYLHAGRFTNESQITTNIAHLSAGRFSEIEFPLPPLEEQRRIVAEVERRLSLAAGVESTLAVSMSRAGRLRQAILKSAFEGRLV
jgi:type I restriction enzyme S subunit